MKDLSGGYMAAVKSALTGYLTATSMAFEQRFSKDLIVY